jgi:hypothetical protein
MTSMDDVFGKGSAHLPHSIARSTSAGPVGSVVWPCALITESVPSPEDALVCQWRAV